MRYKTKAAAMKAAKRLGLRGTHSHGAGKGKIYMAGKTHAAFEKGNEEAEEEAKQAQKRPKSEQESQTSEQIMDIYEKRGRWCVRVNGRLHKFATEQEAIKFLDVPMPIELLETEDASEEKEEGSEEGTS